MNLHLLESPFKCPPHEDSMLLASQQDSPVNLVPDFNPAAILLSLPTQPITQSTQGP